MINLYLSKIYFKERSHFTWFLARTLNSLKNAFSLKTLKLMGRSLYYFLAGAI
ncbi:MAG: hypothetical protein HC764_25300 [Pleurocapsa sp. CRU_1_2]|nr:hypothetical protein [Pleurocapsa sp. CRU_1_2]